VEVIVAGLLDGIAAWFRHLNETRHLNFTIFYDAWDAKKYLIGIGITIKLTLLTIGCSLAIGIIGGAMHYLAGPGWRRAIGAYIELFRNTPVLSELYFFYFGIGTLLTASAGLSPEMRDQFGGFFWAAVTLSLHAGAYNIEIVRAGLEAVPSSTIEAARALGYTPSQSMRHVILPIGLRVCIPSLSNSLVQLVKGTAVAYAVAVPEVLYVANGIWSDNFNVLEMMNVVLVTYLALVGIVVWLVHLTDRALRLPGYAA
jgi:polar amino acid transport system permease protein